MKALRAFPRRGGNWQVSFAAIAALCAISAATMPAQEAGSISVAIKGNAKYAAATPVPVKTAFLVITPVWEDVYGEVTPGFGEPAGTRLYLSDVVVVLSNKAIGCQELFKPMPLAGDDEFLIVGGKAEAYLPANGWQSTPLGKQLADITRAPDRVALDRWSLTAQYTVAKAKTSSKDNLRGNDAQLALVKTGTTWSADLNLKADELTATATKIPLGSCASPGKKAAGTPLLGEKRLQAAADAYR